MSIRTAASKLWGKEEGNVNLMEIDRILKEKATLSDIIPPEPAKA